MKKSTKYAIAAVAGTVVLTGTAIFAYRQFTLFAKRKGERGSHPILPPGKSADDDAREYMMRHLDEMPREVISIRSFDGLNLTGHLFRTNPDNKKVVISFHGYHSTGLGGMGWFAPMYEKAGCDYLIINERAHDTSEGEYITFGVKEKEDGLRWVNEILYRYGEDVQILLHGVSMGAATVMMMAGDPRLPEQVKGIVEDCGYDTMNREYCYLMRKYPKGAVLVADGLMNAAGKVLTGVTITDANVLEKVKDAKIPALMIHGTEDRMVPFEAMKNLDEAYAGPHEIFFVAGAAHANAHAKAPEEYHKRFLAFASKVLEN